MTRGVKTWIVLIAAFLVTALGTYYSVQWGEPRSVWIWCTMLKIC